MCVCVCEWMGRACTEWSSRGAARSARSTSSAVDSSRAPFPLFAGIRTQKPENGSLFLPPSPPSFSTPTHCHRAGASLHDPPCPPLGPRPPFAVPLCVASPPPRHLPAPPAGCRGCTRHCQEKVRRSSAGLHPRREREKERKRGMRVSRVFMTPTLTRHRSTAAFEKRENPDDDNGIRF